MHIRLFRPGDEPALVKLWGRCGLVRPPNDPLHDVQRKITSGFGWLLVGELGARLMASVMIGYEGRRGWLNYVAVDPDFQGRGHARAMLAAAEKILAQTGCPKVNLQVRSANPQAVRFYRHLGYSVDDVVSMGKRLVDDGSSFSTRHNQPLSEHLDGDTQT